MRFGPGPRPGFFGRPGAQLLEKGQSSSRLGAQHLGKGWKIWAFMTAVQFQGLSRLRGQHSVKGSSPTIKARACTFRARPTLCMNKNMSPFSYFILDCIWHQNNNATTSMLFILRKSFYQTLNVAHLPFLLPMVCKKF